MNYLVALMMLFSFLMPQLETQKPVIAMKTGILLRMHVIAQDDTPEMQALKLAVRDEVRRAYASAPAEGVTMLARARSVLPELTQAAERAARRHGYAGRVSLTVEQAAFDERSMDGYTFPAGRYPALIIRLGEAKGHNWWGLVDPELALSCAALAQGEGLCWAWNLPAIFRALWPGVSREVAFCE